MKSKYVNLLWCVACGKRVGAKSEHVRVKARRGISSLADGVYHPRCIDRFDAAKVFDTVTSVFLRQ